MKRVQNGCFFGIIFKSSETPWRLVYNNGFPLRRTRMAIARRWCFSVYRGTMTLSLNWIPWPRVESSLRNWKHSWRPIRSTSRCLKWAGTLCSLKRKRRSDAKRNSSRLPFPLTPSRSCRLRATRLLPVSPYRKLTETLSPVVLQGSLRSHFRPATR